MKFLIMAALVVLGSSISAHADDEISCATDNECIKAKVEAGEAQFHKNRAREARKARKHKAEKPTDDTYVPCAGDDDCQRSGQDAADRDNGITGQED